MEQLQERIVEAAILTGAADVGIADLTTVGAGDLIARQGGRWLAGFPRAVSFTYRLQDALVDPLPEAHQQTVPARLYDRHVYRGANDTLDDIAHAVATELQGAGYKALPLPASMYIDEEDLLGPLPHKLPAHLAGLGWIGRSCLLITRRHGPRVRLGTVLTDAALSAGEPGKNFCGSCEDCVEACPAGAFTGRPFDPDEAVEERMDVRACRGYRQGVKKQTGVMTCGVCVAVCPHGR